MNQPWSDAQVMMTLSAIAYYDDVSGLLQQSAPTAGWSLVWGPALYQYNRAFVAQETATGRYAVAIRGSETTFSWDTFYNWLDDFEVLTQVAWPYFSAAPDCMVSYGAFTQLYNLCRASSGGQTLAAFLTSLPPDAPLLVTGHSLGGNLATVLAAWVSAQRGPDGGAPDANTVIYTFAAPSAGNAAFAQAFNARFPQSWRYWNSLDVVPHAWDTVLEIIGIYDSIGIPTPLSITGAVVTMEGLLAASEAYYYSAYQQPNEAGTELPGHPAVSGIVADIWSWILEVAAQHGSSMYLNLLGAPPVTPSPPSVTAEVLAVSLPIPPKLGKGDVAPRLWRR